MEQALREHAQDQLTQAQATLQQTQKLDAVGRLAGGVAHDFNNTLQVVLGWTELLRSETHPQQIQDGIEQIRASAERSRGLTRQLLAFSRPELNQPTRVNSTRSCRRWSSHTGGSCRTTSRLSRARLRASPS